MKTRAGLPFGGVYVLTQAIGIMGSFFLPGSALSVGFMPATTSPSTSGLQSPGSGNLTVYTSDGPKMSPSLMPLRMG